MSTIMKCNEQATWAHELVTRITSDVVACVTSNGVGYYEHYKRGCVDVVSDDVMGYQASHH